MRIFEKRYSNINFSASPGANIARQSSKSWMRIDDRVWNKDRGGGRGRKLYWRVVEVFHAHADEGGYGGRDFIRLEAGEESSSAEPHILLHSKEKEYLL